MGERGGITDEAVARLRARIGVPEPHVQPPHYRCPGVDAFRHVAEAYDDGRPAVDLDVWAENQRGEVTTPGHATILLPSREHGPVRLPDPPDGATDLQGALTAIAARFERD